MFILAHAKDEKITVCIAVLALLSYCDMQWEFFLHMHARTACFLRRTFVQRKGYIFKKINYG